MDTEQWLNNALHDYNVLIHYKLQNDNNGFDTLNSDLCNYFIYFSHRKKHYSEQLSVSNLQVRKPRKRDFTNLNLKSRCSCCWVVSNSCLTHCNTMDCSLPGSSVCEISQARILECIAFPCSKDTQLGIVQVSKKKRLRI